MEFRGNWSVSNQTETEELKVNDAIQLLQHSIPYVAENAGAYLQRLSFQNDTVKNQIQILDGITVLLSLLSNSQSRVRRRASGVLRNLSYSHTTNSKAIKEEIINTGGLEVFAEVLNTSIDNSLKENVTGIVWNLSSSKELKDLIAEKLFETLVNSILLPLSGLENSIAGSNGSFEVTLHWSNVLFRNASGILKNLSSTEATRKKILTNEKLKIAILHVAKTAFSNGKYDGSKSVENCICIIRNLTYRCCNGEENYENENIFCKSPNLSIYLNVLAGCSNLKTIEAAAGIIQNLAANHDNVSESIYNLNGVSALVKMLILDSDQVVGTVSNALINLIRNKNNKEQIGTFGVTCLIEKLPGEESLKENEASEQTSISVLELLHRLVYNNSELSLFFVKMGGMQKLVYLKANGSDEMHDLVEKIMQTLWNLKKLRPSYKILGWNENQFLAKGKRVSKIYTNAGSTFSNRPKHLYEQVNTA